MTCECGCGLPTRIAPQSHTAKGWVKGQPVRFRPGHYAKSLPQVPISSKWDVAPDGCWLWRSNFSHGYPYYSTTHNGRLRAHRYVYELLVSPIPTGMQLDHLCRVRACVNPQHMEVVTAQVNTLRAPTVAGVNAAKTHCPNGHALSGDNLYTAGGRRHCRACRLASQRATRQRARDIRTSRRSRS